MSDHVEMLRRTGAEAQGSAKQQDLIRRGTLYSFLIVGALIVLMPYLWMIITSLKTEQDMFRVGLLNSLIPGTIRWENYAEAWNDYPLGRWLLNSFIVAAIETVSAVTTAVLAGYAFARLRFWGREVLFVLYLGAMMVPIQVTLIPSFIIVRALGLLNSYQGIAILHVVQFFGVFLMRQFFLNIPAELEDAARIDGCNWFQVLWRIVLPVSMPAVGALSVLTFTAGWNNFLWPLVVINKPEIMTIMVGLASMRSEVTPWGQLMAATAISALPLTIIYIACQRFFTKGIVMTGIKG
ncbi:MAG: carbohydrate ABC transporter permease [Deltaproteobacteria bacterium]|nr:carbohydrate ABC transporter permease [Deltaproteobacteria bacterium]MBW1960671.1 carbohydrate ABC transporter permease [Deltaproteobacteria bacterium]MBW1995008.1 carbohydrate ABC transporter permease [Deltaproteobacteria bacterium]MBW2152060.1 carbohydrate ABC transporter permease [Deltaproteobacteria bacterium]